jgi:hypothetical protein
MQQHTLWQVSVPRQQRGRDRRAHLCKRRLIQDGLQVRWQLCNYVVRRKFLAHVQQGVRLRHGELRRRRAPYNGGKVLCGRDLVLRDWGGPATGMCAPPPLPPAACPLTSSSCFTRGSIFAFPALPAVSLVRFLALSGPDCASPLQQAKR